MDRGMVQARIDAGLGVAAAVLGTPYSVYRPADPMQPLAAPIFTLQAVVGRDPEGGFRAPAGYGVAVRTLFADASGLRVGDVLVGDGATLFVAAIEANAPPLLVDCNARLGLLRLVASPGYGGAAEQAVAAGWPASLRLEGHGAPSPAGLPGDARPPGWQILLPAIPGVVPAAGMRAVDDSGRRLEIAGVELSGLGTRIAAAGGGS